MTNVISFDVKIWDQWSSVYGFVDLGDDNRDCHVLVGEAVELLLLLPNHIDNHHRKLDIVTIHGIPMLRP